MGKDIKNPFHKFNLPALEEALGVMAGLDSVRVIMFTISPDGEKREVCTWFPIADVTHDCKNGKLAIFIDADSEALWDEDEEELNAPKVKEKEKDKGREK